MNIRRIVVATGLCLSLVTAGCASAVAGQAQIASGAVLPTTSQSAPSPFPDPSSGRSSSHESSSSDESTGDDTTTGTPAVTTTDESSSADDTPVESTPATSIPGLSKDCTAVFAGITAFGSVLQGGTADDDTISQATVDKALAQLPASGLSARPQADITVLRTVVSGAVGKTVSEVSMSIVDGKVVTALKDLTSWAEDNCS